jgi:hypothetical protein
VNNELRLTPGALEWHHRGPRDLGRHLGTEIAPHHVKAEIETGRGARGREQFPVVDVEHVGIDGDSGVASRELSCAAPMGSRPQTVEYTGLRQYERAATDRRHAHPSVDRSSDRTKHQFWNRAVDVIDPRNDDRMCSVQGG